MRNRLKIWKDNIVVNNSDIDKKDILKEYFKTFEQVKPHSKEICCLNKNFARLVELVLNDFGNRAARNRQKELKDFIVIEDLEISEEQEREYLQQLKENKNNEKKNKQFPNNSGPEKQEKSFHINNGISLPNSLSNNSNSIENNNNLENNFCSNENKDNNENGPVFYESDGSGDSNNNLDSEYNFTPVSGEVDENNSPHNRSYQENSGCDTHFERENLLENTLDLSEIKNLYYS